jgi:hypothetical protein
MHVAADNGHYYLDRSHREESIQNGVGLYDCHKTTCRLNATGGNLKGFIHMPDEAENTWEDLQVNCKDNLTSEHRNNLICSQFLKGRQRSVPRGCYVCT